ncbi:MAG: hypothetical protein R2758_11140 [Bacteroidales bacterium]
MLGLFGYLLGDALLSKVLIGAVADNVNLGWGATFLIFIVASILAAIFSATTWKSERRLTWRTQNHEHEAT